MYKFFKMQYIAVLTGIILVFLCVAPCCAEEIDTLTMLSGDVSHNMEDASPKSVLSFNFNHRLDHCDNDFSITGGDVTVTGWNIKGTQLMVSLSKSLAYDTQYTLSLTGLSDIYFEEYSTPSISFKTGQEPPTPPDTGGGGGGGGGGKPEKKPDETDEKNTEEENIKVTFPDIAGHWAKDYINDLYSKGVVNGDEKGNFNPESLIKRSEFIAIAIRASGFELSAYKGSFADVKADDWYADIVQTALENGIVSQDVNFRPNDAITREEMAKIITLVAKLDAMPDVSEELASKYTDYMNISPWAKEFVMRISHSGLMTGRDNGNFSPRDNATRAEAATVISHMLEKIKI